MNLYEIVSQLEVCGFACEAGALEVNNAFIELRQKAHAELIQQYSERNNQRMLQLVPLVQEARNGREFDIDKFTYYFAGIEDIHAGTIRLMSDHWGSRNMAIVHVTDVTTLPINI